MIGFSSLAFSAIKITHQCPYIGSSGSSPTQVTASITDRITTEDAEKLVRYTNVFFNAPIDYDMTFIVNPCGIKSKVSVWVDIDSTGGDVDAAMRIGDVLKKANELGRVRVPDQATCFSSCTLVLAAAKRRSIAPTAKVGIHRPYLPFAKQLSQGEMEGLYATLTKRIEDYLRGTDVSHQLVTDMMRIPPDQIRVLTTEQLQSYGLLQDTTATQEIDAMREALSLGVTREEFARRRARAQAVCGRDPCDRILPVTESCLKFALCSQAVMKNSPP